MRVGPGSLSNVLPRRGHYGSGTWPSVCAGPCDTVQLGRFGLSECDRAGALALLAVRSSRLRESGTRAAGALWALIAQLSTWQAL